MGVEAGSAITEAKQCIGYTKVTPDAEFLEVVSAAAHAAAVAASGQPAMSEEATSAMPQYASGDEPEDDLPEYFSRGSKNHKSGQCRPCSRQFTAQGCPQGLLCNFCHFPHDENKMREAAAFSAKASLRRANGDRRGAHHEDSRQESGTSVAGGNHGGAHRRGPVPPGLQPPRIEGTKGHRGDRNPRQQQRQQQRKLAPPMPDGQCSSEAKAAEAPQPSPTLAISAALETPLPWEQWVNSPWPAATTQAPQPTRLPCAPLWRDGIGREPEPMTLPVPKLGSDFDFTGVVGRAAAYPLTAVPGFGSLGDLGGGGLGGVGGLGVGGAGRGLMAYSERVISI